MNCWGCICQYSRGWSWHTRSWITANHHTVGCRYRLSSIFFSRAWRKTRERLWPQGLGAVV